MIVRMRYLLLTAAAMALAIGFLIMPAHADPEPAVVEIGQSAPAFSVQTRDGRWEAWTNFKGPGGLIVAFVTEDSLGLLQSVAALDVVQSGTLPLLAVIISCAGESAPCAHADHEIVEFVLRYDPRGDVARLYKTPSAPYLVTVDDHGVVRFKGGLGNTQQEWDTVAAAIGAIGEGREPAISIAPAMIDEGLLRRCPN